MKKICIPFCLLAFAAMIGCGSGIPSDIPKLYPAKATITLEGAPLAGASIALTSTEGGQLPVGGTTDQNGVVVFYTNGRYEGAPAGKYKVTTSSMVQVDGPTSKTPPPTDPAELATYNKRVYDERRYEDILADEFKDYKKSPLDFEITSGKNDATFEVKRKK